MCLIYGYLQGKEEKVAEGRNTEEWFLRINKKELSKYLLMSLCVYVYKLHNNNKKHEFVCEHSPCKSWKFNMIKTKEYEGNEVSREVL